MTTIMPGVRQQRRIISTGILRLSSSSHCSCGKDGFVDLSSSHTTITSTKAVFSSNDRPFLMGRGTDHSTSYYFSTNSNGSCIENDTANHPSNLKQPPPQRMPWVTLGTYLAVRMAGENTQSLRTFLKPNELEWVLEGFMDAMRKQHDDKTTTATAILDKIDPKYCHAANEIQQRIQNEMRIRIETLGQEYCQSFRKLEQQNVQTTTSGLLHRIDNPGIGPIPTIQDLVEVHYHGILVADGTVIDSTRVVQRRGTSSSPQTRIFPVAAVIDGWKEALGLLKVGGKGRFVMPPHLAYGNEGSQIVPPGSTLQYDIELVRIVSTTSEQTTTTTTTIPAKQII